MILRTCFQYLEIIDKKIYDKCCPVGLHFAMNGLTTIQTQSVNNCTPFRSILLVIGTHTYNS